MITPAYARTMAAYNTEMNRGSTPPPRASPTPSGGATAAPSGNRSTARWSTCSGATGSGCRDSTDGRGPTVPIREAPR